MRLRSIALEEFRGWVEPQRVDLDASVVVIHGANGTGKTSLLDAVMWVLIGELARLGEQHKKDVQSLYGDSGNTRVQLELVDAAGNMVAITRSTDGESSRLRVEAQESVWTDEAAEAELLRLLWPNAIGVGKSTGLASTLARAVYLQQDDVRRFIEADDDAERFGAVAELVGAGRYGDLQRQLERERLSWSRGTNERRDEAAKASARLAALRAQIASLPDRPPAISGWQEWRKQVMGMVPDAILPESASDARATEAINSAVRQLDQLSRQSARRLEQLQQLELESAALQATVAPSREDVRAAEEAVSAAAESLASARAEMLEAEKAAAAERAELTRQRSEREELRSLARLALRHLGETCPVCQQTYDGEKTRAHLLALADQASAGSGAPAADYARQLSDAVAEAETKDSEARSQRDEILGVAARRDAAMDRLNLLRQDLGVTSGISGVELAELIAKESERVTALRGAARLGEGIALQVVQASESLRREEMAASEQAAANQVERETEVIARRDSIAALAGRMIDALRAASDDLVSERVRELAPLLDRIYARVDPHPSFQVVELLTRVWRGRGRLDMRITDPLTHVDSQTPHVVLSSSQLNALALSVFLTLNLGVERPPLAALLLDDPLQSLDEVNLLGVVDLLRRIKPKRQIIIATHDRKASELLVRKLRPIDESDSLGLVRLAAWERSGPVLQQATVPADSQPWRIVAHG